MNEKCEKFLEEVLSPELELSVEGAKHLKECKECATLRADVMTFAPVAPAAKLEAKIFATRPVRKHVWHWVSFAAAASIFAIVGLGVINNIEHEPKVQVRNVETAEVATPVAVTVSFDLADLEEASYDLDTELSAYSYALNDY